LAWLGLIRPSLAWPTAWSWAVHITSLVIVILD
jgi:hypothetical protein